MPLLSHLESLNVRALAVTCPACGSPPDRSCRGARRPIGKAVALYNRPPHFKRLELAAKPRRS